MTLDQPPSSGEDPTVGLDVYLESFVRKLHTAGYALRTIRKKRCVVVSFFRWLRQEQVSVVDVNESHEVAFLERTPGISKDRLALERAAVRGFLQHLCAIVGAVDTSDGVMSEANAFEESYEDYLRNERGLSERSVQVYRPFVKAFLGALLEATGSVAPTAVGAQLIRGFLLKRVRGRSGAYARLVAVAVRSFLRFLYVRGETAEDLSLAVPTVRQWRLAPVHAFFSPAEVERILSTPDRTTPGGRRDYAILILLARLGLRAGEVVRLELGDIHWRTSEIVVRGKGRIVERLPLLSEVGEALALYIRKDRGHSSTQQVFLRKMAPCLGLTGPAAIGHVVRTALARAEVRRSHRGAAHLFRHSLATRMIRHGASLEEIAEVLRHRSPATTEIYAKVEFQTLRGVARPWPSSESGQ